MDEQQQKWMQTMLGNLRDSSGRPDRETLLRFAAAQMDDDGRKQLQQVMHDREAIAQILRSDSAQQLMQKLRRKDE